MAERIGDLKNFSGTDRLEIAAELSAEAIALSTALTNAEIEDPARYKRGVKKVTDGWNDIIKSVKKK